MSRSSFALERLEPREVPARLDSTVFVTHLYSDVFGRVGDQAGQQYWQNLLQSGVTRATAAELFLGSDEARAAATRDLYAHYLGRSGRADEIAAWLRTGADTLTQRALFLASDAYFRDRGNGTAEGFLNALFQDVLGRPVDQAGKDFYLPLLGGGATRESVARLVLQSDEACFRTAGLAYAEYLHRDTTGNERAAAAKVMADSGFDEDFMRSWVLGSDGFTAQARQSAGDAVQEWAINLAAAVRTDRTPPPRGARIMALTTLAMYDALQSSAHQPGLYNPATPLSPDGASGDAAAAAAAYRVLVTFYPAQKATLDAQLAATLARIPDALARDAGQRLGLATADALLAARASDGSAATVAYTPGTVAPAWQPTPGPAAASSYRPGLVPGWGQITPFFVTNGAQFRPPAPPAPGTAEYEAARQEVFDLGSVNSTKRTADQTQIALFWADNPDGTTSTPPGHWIEIAAKTARDNGYSLAESARLLAMVGAALGDAGISSWDAKYAYNYWRPVTALNNLENAAQVPPEQYATLAWRPLLATPNFPSYTSGHSTFSNAAAEVLTKVFGDNYAFTATSDGAPNVTRSFSSFRAAAAEAGQSRIYGGIHWQFDNTAGSAAGVSIGDWVFAHFPK